jgi:ribosome-binding protein aMBF1 (putative translation factor)
MQQSKRKRLESKGWAVGSTQEFLGLSNEEAELVELRLRLAQGVKHQRNAKGMTQKELAKAVGSSQSRVAKMEAGDATVSIDLLVRSLLRMGTSRREIGQIIARRQRAA